jgi:hypothetical protein
MIVVPSQYTRDVYAYLTQNVIQLNLPLYHVSQIRHCLLLLFIYHSVRNFIHKIYLKICCLFLYCLACKTYRRSD